MVETVYTVSEYEVVPVFLVMLVNGYFGSIENSKELVYPFAILW